MNAVPYTKKLEALAKFAVRRPVMQALRDDAAKALDSAAYDQFNLCQLRVVASGGNGSSAITLSTNSTPASANNLHLTKQHVRLIHDEMADRNIPYYDGDNYVAIGRPKTFTGLKTELESVNQYVTEGYRKIMNGEIGRFESIRFVQQTHIANQSWTNGKSDEVFFFGKETVMEGIAEPEHTRAKIPDDYGRSMGVAWYYLGGFAIVHNWDTTVDTGAANGRIVKWDSSS